MDKEILVARLKSAFSEVHLNGPEINAFVLSPSYGGAVRDSYILGVSAPSLAYLSKGSKIRTIFGIIFNHLEKSDRKQIDSIVVFDSISALMDGAKNNFLDGSDYFPEPKKVEAELVEIN